MGSNDCQKEGERKKQRVQFVVRNELRRRASMLWHAEHEIFRLYQELQRAQTTQHDIKLKSQTHSQLQDRESSSFMVQYR
jgi:hypothetical protein